MKRYILTNLKALHYAARGSTFFLLGWLLIHAASVCAQTVEPLAKLDSLLNLYGNSTGHARLAVGKQIMDGWGSPEVFFGEPPTLDGSLSTNQQDLCVWFTAERYLTTNAYYKEALQYISKALSLLPRKPQLSTSNAQLSTSNSQLSTSNLQATLLCDQAYCLYKTSDYTAAIEAGREAMRLCQQTGNTLQLSRAYLYLSIVNHALRKYDEATALVVKAIETNELADDHKQLHNALGIACELFCSAKEVDRAIGFGKRAVEEARKLEYMPGVANHLTQLSYAYDRKGDYVQGLQVADEAITIVKAQKPLDRNQLALALEYKSWNLIDIGRHAEAVEALREAIRLEEEVGNTHAAWNDLRTLAEAMTPIDPRGAVDVLNRYVRMSDSIHTEQMKELMSQANAEFHNDELREENDATLRMNRIILWTFLVVLLLLAVALVSLWFVLRQKQRSADLLQCLVEARDNVTHEIRSPVTVLQDIGQEEMPSPAPVSQIQSAPLPHREDLGDGSLPSTSQSTEFIDRVHDAILRLMPQGNLDVDSIAAELCLSPSQLRRKMNAVTGMPPKKFVMQVRMDAASEMMQQHPDMKLSDIAEKCGFYDLSHFIRLYKETYGTTPAASHRK